MCGLAWPRVRMCVLSSCSTLDIQTSMSKFSPFGTGLADLMAVHKAAASVSGSDIVRCARDATLTHFFDCRRPLRDP